MKMRAYASPLFLAIALLTFGLSVYLFDRPADQIYFIPDGWQLSSADNPLFGSMGACLPSFVHVAIFILITGVLLKPWRFPIASICLLWFGIDILFELAQHPNQVMLHEQLLSAVWGSEYRDDIDYLRAYIHYLRKKLETDASQPKLIVTVPGVGYMLVMSQGERDSD